MGLSGCPDGDREQGKLPDFNHIAYFDKDIYHAYF